MYIYLVFERSNPPIVLLGIFSRLVSGINHGGIIHTGESWWQASVHLSRIPGFVGLLPSRCTVLHGDAAVDADFLEPFSRCTCIAGWIVLNGRLDHIEWAVGSDCIGGWTVLYNVSAVGSYQSDRSFIHIVSAVGSYRIGG